jgi:hypothetical protein
VREGESILKNPPWIQPISKQKPPAEEDTQSPQITFIISEQIFIHTVMLKYTEVNNFAVSKLAGHKSHGQGSNHITALEFFFYHHSL